MPSESPLAAAITGRRAWWLALGLSLLLHFTAIVGLPALDLGWLVPPVRPQPLEARIVQAPPPAPAAAPAKPTAKPKPRPKPVPPPPAAINIPDPDPRPAESVASEPVSPPASEQNSAEPPPTVADAAPATSAPPEPTPAIAPVETAAPPPKPPPVQHPLRRVRLEYDFLQGENPLRLGRVIHTWSNDGERYTAETIAEGQGFIGGLYGAIFGTFVQRSSGTFDANGLTPREFSAHRGTKSDRLEQAAFDWDGNLVSFKFRNGSSSAALAPGVQDPVSVLYQLYFMRPLANETNLQIANGRKLGAYALQIVGTEDLETPIGTISTLRVKRTDDGNDSLELWLDPSRFMLPMRIMFIERRGSVYAQMIRSIELEPR